MITAAKGLVPMSEIVGRYFVIIDGNGGYFWGKVLKERPRRYVDIVIKGKFKMEANVGQVYQEMSYFKNTAVGEECFYDDGLLKGYLLKDEEELKLFLTDNKRYTLKRFL